MPTDNDKLILKNPNWEKAVFLDDDASIIEVPLTYFSFSENLNLVQEGTNQDRLKELQSKNTVKKLILIKSGDGEYNIQVQVISPDADNAIPISNDITFKQLKKNSFKGTLLYFNWYEEYLYGESYGKDNKLSVKKDDED